MDILDRFSEIINQSPFPFVLEFGACDGYHSNELVKRIKSVDRPFIFHCFEPSTEKFEQIVNNLKDHLMYNYGCIGIFPNAIGEENEVKTFYQSYGQKIENGKVVDNYYGSSSVRKPTEAMLKAFPGMKFKETTTTVVTLDSHIERFEFPIIDFIWADIQGNENAMIKGGEKAFLKVKYLYTEYSNNEDYEGQTNLQGILDLLPHFEIVEDYGGDVLLKNKIL